MTKTPSTPLVLDDDAFFDLTAPMLVDDPALSLWESGKCLDRWVSRDHVIAFARKALRSATFLALCELEPLARHEYRQDWLESEKLGQAALDAMNALLNHMAGGKPALREHEARSLQPVLSQMLTTTRYRRGETSPTDDPAATSRLQAQTLFDAAKIVQSYTGFSASQVDHIAGLGLQNPGDPILKTFVLHMAEGWLALCGKAPGSNPRLDKNPFLRFAAAGWTDAGGNVVDTAETFAQEALKAAIPIMNERLLAEQLRPFWA